MTEPAPTPAKRAAVKKAAIKPPTEPDAVPAAPASDPHAETWAALTAPFPADWIEKLPKPVKSKDDDKGRCVEGSRYSADDHYCGKWHARSVHLDYVGHAGITMRLNSILGPGGWEFTPYGHTDQGTPLMTQSVFFAQLTILDVTKWDMAANFNGPQEAYGDALRRCAMRFGIGTYLWSKSEAAANLAASADAPPPTESDQPAPAVQGQGSQEVTYTPLQVQVNQVVASLTDDERTIFRSWVDENRVPAPHLLSDKAAGNLLEYLEWLVGQRSRDAHASQHPDATAADNVTTAGADGPPWPDTTPHDAAPPS
jgi:hypothetical protein